MNTLTSRLPSLLRPVALALVAVGATGLLPKPAAAQCTSAYLAHLGGRPTAIAARGSLGYVAYPGEIRIIDVSNPGAPRVEGSVLIPATVDELHLDGDYIYAACNDAGLFIIDAGTPSAPMLLSTVSTEARRVAVSNDLAFVVGEDVTIVDVANPSAPQIEGSYPTTGFVGDIVSAGSTVYVIDSDVLVLDASNPGAPALLAEYSLQSGYAHVAVLRAQRLYVGSSEGVEIVDVSNPAAPVFLGRVVINDGVYDDLAIMESGATTTLWTESDFCELSAYDVTNPGAPVLLSTVVDVCFRELARIGTTLFCRTGSGILAFDCGNPSAPVQVFSGVNAPDFPRGVGIVGQHMAVADGEELLIYNVANPSSPALVSTFALADFAQELRVIGTRAYVAESVGNPSSGVLEIIDLSTPAAPALLGATLTTEYLIDLEVVGTLVLTLGIDGLLEINDVSNPGAPRFVGSLGGLGYAVDMAVGGGFAYVGDDYAGLHVIDISDPASPRLAATLPTRAGEYLEDMVLRGTTMFIAQSDRRVDIYDMADPLSPVLRDHFVVAFGGVNLGIVDSLLVVSQYTGRLSFVDTADPANAMLLTSIELGGSIDEFAFRGLTMWASGPNSGVLAASVPGYPRVRTSPAPVQACPGSDADFSVTGAGPGPLTYQWRRNGVNLVNGLSASGSTISGALSPHLRITSVHGLDLGLYDCVVSNGCGSVTSADAALTPAIPPTITQQPRDEATCPSGSAVFSIAGLVTPPVTYQWERETPPRSGTFVPLADGANVNTTITGAATRVLRISATPGRRLPPGAATLYRCVVGNDCATVTSTAGRLTICPADFNCDGSIGSQDFFEFLREFFAAGPSADFNGDGTVNSQDFFDFLAAFFAPCG